MPILSAFALFGAMLVIMLLRVAMPLGVRIAGEPVGRFWGCRPYTPGGPVFRRLGRRTWLATGGRKMGTMLGASCARRLLEESEAGLDRVARECGFGGADSMRRSFLRVLRVAPGAYRGRFLSGPVGSA